MQGFFRYALRDVSASDLEAAIVLHKGPKGRAAVARSVEAVGALVAHSQYVLENLDKPIPPIEIPNPSAGPR